MQYPMIDKKQTAKRIQFLMHCTGIKPKDIQEYLGLTCVQTVYRWLDGTNIPSVDNLYALSRLFGVKVDDMLAGDDKVVPMPLSYVVFECCEYDYGALFEELWKELENSSGDEFVIIDGSLDY